MRLLVLTLLIGCEPININASGCPYPDVEFQEVAARFVEFVPESFDVIDRTDIICEQVPYYYNRVGMKVAGETLWPGSELARARIKVAAELDTYPDVKHTATAHEFMHLYLWDTTGDPCAEHVIDCGWDELLIEEVNNE